MTGLGALIQQVNGSRSMYYQIKDYLTKHGTEKTVHTIWGTVNPFDEPEIFVDDDLLKLALNDYRMMHAENYRWYQVVDKSNDILNTKAKPKSRKGIKPKRPINLTDLM